ncbi:uncharacterized protein LOC111128726 [Crassostrea virginica]|uniref:Uncharacterized protein LOC111128726 n=1 Tax=Crassostrea virginica TaxID=6565 RepID=A0A8B8DS12_CRAVI|nr:uncharacterized protein LOC111128726 [Crassostrea virginica]XP_022330324.1 uncharacterized protein LOC111128771 [Crassostrea virginica]XP_022330325.1 uncharacterized protein LOC111128771 [Crassostrea virginica]
MDPFVVAGMLTAVGSLVLFSAGFVGFCCWKHPSLRTRTFWDKQTKKILRVLYNKIQREKEKPEESKTIVMPAMRRRQSEQTKFVVPRIYVDYGSRRTSYASDYFRRSSGESGSSRRTSCASSLASMDDRRGSGSSLSSRRTSAASDVDRRGSGSSICSRRTSLLSSECPSRRGSGSSKSSRKSSDASRVGDITDDILADFSDSEIVEEEEYTSVLQNQEPRRSSLEENFGKTVAPADKKMLYRRSHSLAEIRPTHVFLPEGRGRADGRRITLSSLALDNNVSKTGPQYQRKKPKLNRPVGIGLPDRPVIMHDLNLEEMVVHRMTIPLHPTGKLKVQFQYLEDRTSLTVIIIEARRLRIEGLPNDTELNPYVKAFLVPGKSFKYRTKTIPKSKNPAFLEKFIINDIVPSDINDDTILEFQVYSSHHVTRRHLVGVASISLRAIETLENGLVDLTIMPQTVFRLHQGDIRISGCYQPVAGKMVFNILEARNIPRVSILGAVNPYVKAEMFVNGIREAKDTTKTRQNTQDPMWNHQVVFEINRENPKLLGHVFVFRIFHKDMMMGVQEIGQVEFGWHSHGEQLDHWYDIMEHPHRPTDYWHQIIKTSKT